MSNNERIAIIGACRTPFTKIGTELKSLHADDLGVLALRESIVRATIKPDDIDEVVGGCCAQPAHSANVGRVVACRAGIPNHVPAITVHRNCATGMEAMSTAAQRLLLGESTIVATFGAESMSNIPFLFNDQMKGFYEKLASAKSFGQKLSILASFRLSHLKPIIGLKLGLTDPICNLIMGATAENVSRDFKINRNEQDEFALRSHINHAAAQENGYYNDEIFPVHLPNAFKQTIIADNGVRKNQTIEALQKLKPFFDRKLGTVTVGSSSQVTDGAGACILMRETTAKELRLTPLGYIKGYSYAGCDPSRMGLGPVFATHKLLKKHNMTLDQMELVEINEAFAAQTLGCIKAFESKTFAKKELNENSAMGKLPLEKLNVNGGAIAIGHPLAASGQRIVMTLLFEMHRRELQTGLATLCVGGGQGGAFLLERQ